MAALELIPFQLLLHLCLVRKAQSGPKRHCCRRLLGRSLVQLPVTVDKFCDTYVPLWVRPGATHRAQLTEPGRYAEGLSWIGLAFDCRVGVRFKD